MPRIDINHNYVPRPTGVLKAKLIDFGYYDQVNDLPNMKHLRDLSNNFVMRFDFIPEGYERDFSIYVPVKIVKDSEDNLDLKNSRGIRGIHMILDALGDSKAGFNAEGKFVDANDKELDYEKIIDYLAELKLKNDEAYMYIYVYKVKGKDNRSYFQSSLRFYPFTEEGRKQAEAAYERDKEYIQSKENPIPKTSTTRKLF